MKLQEFVSETLKEIIAGAKEAQQFAKSEGAWVNPRIHRPISGKADMRLKAPNDADIEMIEFDVAVTSTEESSTESGAGIFISAIGIGTKGKSDASSSSISRIKFSIPLGLPIQKEINYE